MYKRIVKLRSTSEPVLRGHYGPFRQMVKKAKSDHIHDTPLFYVNFPKKELFKRSVLYSGAVVWNALPVETRLIDNVAAFKSEQKRLMYQ